MELIVAVDRFWAIGRGETLLFSIPEDLARFKELTLGNAIVYGRRTMATFPGGKPLPGRRNYVLTHFPETLPAGAVGAASVPELLTLTRGEEKLFVAGGESVYHALLSHCTRAHVTKVDAGGGGDRFCPNLDERTDWELSSQSESHTWNGLTYRFCEYQRR